MNNMQKKYDLIAKLHASREQDDIKKKEKEFKEAYEKLNPLEKKQYDLEIENLKQSNDKLKNEWWHIIVAGIIGGMFTISASIISEQVQQSEKTKESVCTCKKPATELINSNQKDTLKTK